MTNFEEIKKEKQRRYFEDMKESHLKFLRGNIKELKGDMSCEEFNKIIEAFDKYAVAFPLTRIKCAFRIYSEDAKKEKFFKQYPDVYFFN